MEDTGDEIIIRRGRGRPKGVKNSKPRRPRENRLPVFDPGLSVLEKLGLLKHPVHVSVISQITGLSEATLRRRVEDGTLPAFQSRGIVLLDPAHVQVWWSHRAPEPDE